jgi:Ca-activated chloride channel homolog
MRALVVLGPFLTGSILLAQTPPVFRAEIGVVVLQATVHNGRGQPITDLGRGAFTVYENGARQAITIFRHGDVPISLGILLDNSRSMRGKREAAETAALGALRASRPQDETFVMNFADKARVDVPLTDDVTALSAAVPRRDSIGGTALWDAIAQAQDYPVERAARERKVLLVITDGNDNASVVTLQRLKQQGAEKDIAVFAIGIASPDDATAARRGRDALDDLTEASGGVAHHLSADDEADARGRRTAQQMRHFYTIGYAPIEQTLDGTYRTLRVVAKGNERLRVKSRAGYRATPASTRVRKQS